MTVDGLYSQDGSKHAVRVRRFLLAGCAYALCVPLLVVAHVLGFIHRTPVVVATALIVAVNASLYMMFRTRANERCADPSLTWPQVLLGNVVLMYVVYHFDHDRAMMESLMAFKRAGCAGVPKDVPAATACWTAATTSGWAWPRMSGPHEQTRSTYSLPSTSYR